jgi:hypothetical protein
MGTNYKHLSCEERTMIQLSLNLVLAQRYLENLLANKLVAKYLRQHQPDVMEQFEKIVATKSLDQSG